MNNLVPHAEAILESLPSITIDREEREGIEVEKGVILTESYLEEHEELFRQYCEFFTAYPDIFLDIIKPQDSNFSLFFYQRIALRAMMRYKEVYITAPRAFSKSFITIMALLLQCIFIPGTRRFICAPNKKQSAQIAKEKIGEIYDKYPLIRREVLGGHFEDMPGNFGADYVKLTFRNGSTFEVVGALESTRGQRKHGGLVDETRDHDEQLISEVVLPLLNVSRRLPNNTVNQKEPNQQTLFMTSAGTKTSYAYIKLIDVFENSIINPENSFCFGCDYRIPVMHGLLDKDFVNKMRLSPSYDETSFAREYLSRWSGASEESWFSFDKLNRRRQLKNPETSANNMNGPNEFYLLSTDVGRLNDQTVCVVFKVNVVKGIYMASLVNIYVLGLTAKDKTFDRQAIDLKRIIRNFNPYQVVIDINGLKLGHLKSL